MGKINPAMKDYYKEMLDAIRRCLDAEYQMGYDIGFEEAKLDGVKGFLCRYCAHFGDAVDGETYCTLHSHKAKPHDFCAWWEDGR